MPVACPACGADVTELANQYIATAITATPLRTLRVARETESSPETSSREAAIQRVQAVAQDRAPLEQKRAAAREVAELRRWRGPFQIALLGAMGLLVVWIWYAFLGSKPRPTFNLTASLEAPFRYSQMLGRDRVFVLRDDKAAVYAIKSGEEVWSSPIVPAERTRGQAAWVTTKPDETLVRVVGDSIWLGLPGKVVRLDSATGRRLTEIPLSGPLESVQAGESALVAIAENAPFQRALTRVDLHTGKTTTELVSLPALQKVAARSTPADRGQVEHRYFPLNNQVAVLSARLLEQRFITREGPSTESRRERSDKPLIERENLRAADSTEAIRQFLDAGKGGGSVEYDESRYQVMVQRLFGPAPPWSAEVVGRPELHPAGGLDLLTAGTVVRALDSANRLVWSAQLSYPLDPRRHSDQPPPVVASGSRLYVCDLGTLTTFTANSGQVVWRLPSVGISQVVPIGEVLYVATTSAGPESIRPMGGGRNSEKSFPVLLKVDAATGKVLWQLDRVADRAWPSGKFLYVSRTAAAALDELNASMNGREANAKFHLRRLDPATGKQLWDWHQDGRTRQVAADGNQIFLANPTSIKVLTFLAW